MFQLKSQKSYLFLVTIKNGGAMAVSAPDKYVEVGDNYDFTSTDT